MNSDDIHFHFYDKEIKFNDTLVIISTRGISSIVADYLIGHLDLKLVGGIYSKHMYLGTEIVNGVPLTPFQIYAGEYQDIEDTDFDQIVLISTFFELQEDVIWDLCNQILKWCNEIEATSILSMVPIYRKQANIGGKVNIYHVFNNPKLEQYLPHLRTTAYENGAINGYSGVLQYLGAIVGVPVISLIAEVHPDFKDSRAAAAILESINQLVPKIEMDHEPLLKEAENLEEQFMQSMRPDNSSFA